MMAGRISFNKRSGAFLHHDFEDSYNSLLQNTFDVGVRETGGEYLVEAEIPGVKKEEINLSVKKETLCISVIREENADQNDENYVHDEQRTNSMSRSIHLANANLAKITAEFEHDMLLVTIPKQEKMSMYIE